MRIEHRNLTWTLVSLLLAGALCKTWKVEYQQQHICAVRGSTIVIHCSFHHPEALTVKGVRWGHVKPGSEGYFISVSSSRKTTRFQYIGDNKQTCSLKIHQVDHNDTGKYTVRLFLKNNGQIKFGEASPTLKVVDLNVLVTNLNENRATKEGDSVNMTCINSCEKDQLSSAFTWFKNGQLVNEGPVLYLGNVSSTNSGNYTCSLKTHRGASSGVININVEYGPKNTSASVRTSDAGSTITLICSGRANPPVENYTWFKIEETEDALDVGHQPVFVPADGGQFFCSATNKHGSQNSSVVTVKTEESGTTITRDVLITSTVAVLLVVAAVYVIRRLDRKRKWAPEADCAEDTQDTDYVNWLICDNNQSQEQTRFEGGATEIVYATIDFDAKRKSNTQQQMDSCDDSQVIYTTVCRSQPLNPSYIDPT